DWMTNYGAIRLSGGLDLLSKILGKPGKMGVSGDQVYSYYQQGKLQAINDYCMCDTLDTYFVFLRSRVLTGELTLEEEHEIVARAKSWLTGKVAELPALQSYLDNWGDWQPWPSKCHARQNGSSPLHRKCPKPRRASQLFSALACWPRSRRQEN